MKLAAAAAAMLLSASLAALAQAPGKVFRIGFLANSVPLADLRARVPSHPAGIEFEQAMRRLGWVDGKNMQIVWRSAEGRLDELPKLAEELVRIPVDVIVAFGPGVHAAAARTKTIPIVMATYGTPVEDGLVKSLARPGGNVTGLTLEPGTEIHGKRLALLKSIAPKTSRVAFMALSPDPPPKEARWPSKIRAAAKALGLSLVLVTYPDAEGLERAFAQAVGDRANALLFTDTPLLYWPRAQARISDLAARHRIPVMHTILVAPELGALATYAPDIRVNYRRAAYFVDRILKGDKPADLPVEQPSTYQFVVNLRAAKAIGLAIPPSALAEADRVIE